MLLLLAKQKCNGERGGEKREPVRYIADTIVNISSWMRSSAIALLDSFLGTQQSKVHDVIIDESRSLCPKYSDRLARGLSVKPTTVQRLQGPTRPRSVNTSTVIFRINSGDSHLL